MKVLIILACVTYTLAASVKQHSLSKRQAEYTPPLLSNVADIFGKNFRFQNSVGLNNQDPLLPSVGNTPFNPFGPNFPFGNPAQQNVPYSSGYTNHNNDFYNHLDTHFPNANSKCVKAYNIEDDLGVLSDSTEGYPIDAINIERSQRQDLPIYLPPVLAETTSGVFDVDYSYSCPTIKKRLRSFDRYGGRCWVLSDLQEVDYGYCAYNYCNSHHHGNAFQSRNMCIESYDIVYVWAYCDNYEIAAVRIREEAIRVPKYCSCKNVRCA
ncbi:uncharacterized protein [Haliotis cracherodii]|uniref:uncharacterized protein n=1 Tax=Haliotis cracherodii TaxID=6455 RepID=UPI0039E7E120